MSFRPVVLALAAAATLMSPVSAQAATVPVAVAANFTAVAETLARAFEAETGNTVQLSFGATGALYTQITQGAPFEVFLAADDERPKKAVDEGFAVEGTVFTYAIGKLALYAPAGDLADGEAVLKAGDFQKLAIADPAAAPYGAAAMETLTQLGLTQAISPKLVTGESITQALQFVETGNAELGFVALSQVIDRPSGTVWTVPEALHTPIWQDAVLLETGKDDAAARAFLDFLRSDAARTLIEAAGYEVPR